MDNGQQFVSKFFATVTAQLVIKHMTIAPYHPQIARQMERFKRRIVASIPPYVSEHHTDSDHNVQLLTDAFNAWAHRSTGTTPSS